MQAASKATVAALLAVLLAASTAEAQGDPAAPPAPPLTASQLIAAARDPSLSSARVVELAVSAATPGMPVSSSAELWQALQSADEVTAIVLQGNVALDSKNWSKVLIPAGRVVVIRSQLHTDGLNVSSSPDAIPLAGAPTLNMGQIEEAVVFDSGAMLVLQAIVLNNQPFGGAWTAHRAAAAAQGAAVEPGNLGINSGIICRADCMFAHRWLFVNYWSEDCSADVIAGNVYRGSVLLKNVSSRDATLAQLNGTAYALLGSASPDDTVYNCQADPTANASTEAPASSSTNSAGGGGSGTAAWVWVVVALAATAGTAAAATAACLLLRRRRRRRGAGAAAKAALHGSPAGSVLVVGQSQAASLGTVPSPRQSPANGGDKEDLEKESRLTGPEGDLLHEVWGSRAGDAVRSLALLEPLARGGFAVVWKARWKGILVAAKLIEHALSEGEFEAARAEAALSASVAHPNVCTYAVHTLSVADLARLQQAAAQPVAGLLPCSGAGALPGLGATLIVQELCSCSVERCMLEGKVLYQPDGGPDQVAILRMLIDAAQGLEYLASVGVVHGDVKAANVLISMACGTKRGWQAKIADLGLSRLLPPNASSMAALQQTGTAAYMAPEVISCGRITRAADVYAFGVLMYEVWTRRRAWAGLSVAQMGFEVVSRQRRPPVPPDCPPGFAALMARCWSQVPEDRPTFQAVLQSLQALLRPLLPLAIAASHRITNGAGVQPATMEVSK
ncbi:hypothetical protein ABPG75_001528 [Micractinium tetrahymenae]